MTAREMRRVFEIRGDVARHGSRSSVAYHASMFRFTVGVEEEFQIVDPNTGELKSHVSELLASSEASLGDQIKRELHQSIVEVGTRICNDVGELREEIFRIRRDLASSADRAGLAVAAAGTHP